MTTEQTWTIVQFEDNSVEAVPTIWIQGDFCHWPPFSQQKLNTAIRKSEPLNTCWPTHRVKIFRHGTFDDYWMARQKTRKAEETSDLASDLDNNNTLTKRKRIQKVLSTSSSEDSKLEDSYLLPPPPKIKISKFGKKDKNPANNMANRENKDPVFENHNTSTNDLELDDSANTSAAKSDTAMSRCCLHEEHTTLMELKTQNHMIRGILVDILKDVRSLKATQTSTEKLQVKSIYIKYLPDINFPISTENEFEKFEEVLKHEENFVEAVNEIAKCGGTNPYNFIKRTLSSLVKDVVLQKFSWYGRKGKKVLAKSLLARLLIRAADKALDTTQKSVEMAIQSYIKRCAERLNATENKRN